MAVYRTREDGLLEVTYDDGSVSPGLPPSIQGSLEAEGIMPERPEALSLANSGATAGLGPMPASEDDAAIVSGYLQARQAEAAAQVPHSGNAHVAPQQPSRFDQIWAIRPEGAPQSEVSQEEETLRLVRGNQPEPQHDPRVDTAREVAAEMQRGSYYVAPREARDVLVGYTEQGRAPLPEEQLQERRDNMAAQAAEQRWQGVLAGERADREQEARQVQLQAAYQEVEREKELQERREATAARLKAEADRAKQEIQKVDPEAYWEGLGGGQRLAAILAVAFGGFAGGFSGSGRNVGLEMLQSAIRENVEAQKLAIAQQEDRYSEAREAYEKALAAAGGDERSADLIYEIGLGRVYAQQALEYARQSESDELRSQAEQMALQIEEANAEKEAELSGLTRVRAAQFAHQEARAGGVVRPSYEQTLERLAKRHELERKVGLRDAPVSDEDRERMIVLPGGQRVYAPAKDDRKVLRDQLQGTQKMLTAIEFQESIIDTPAKSLSLEKRAESEANARVLGGFARNLLVGPGAVTDSERAIIEQAVAQDAAGMFSLDTTNRAALRILKKYSQQELQGVYDQLSSTPTGWTPLTPPDQIQGRGTKGW